MKIIVLGDRTKKENKCSFPINPEFKSSCLNIWWDNYPPQNFGPHDCQVENLNHLKDLSELAFIQNIFDCERKIGFSYPTDQEKFSEGVRLTDFVDLKSLGVWHEIMKPGRRSSWPHTHKLEEEAAIILKGTAKVWLNGYIHKLTAGDCVYFKPGTGIAHVIINDSDDDLEFIGLGEANDGGSEEKICYPLNQTRNEQCLADGYYWDTKRARENFGSDLGIPNVKSINIAQLENINDFLNSTKELLYSKEDEYSLLLGFCESLQKQEFKSKYLFFSINQESKLLAAAVLSPINLVVTYMSEPISKQFCDFLMTKKIDIPGVVGPAMTAEFISRIYGNLINSLFVLAMSQKIYKLENVIFSNNPKGKMYLVTN